ncbi:MAG: 30S ribosomal protein S3 [Candidatus Woesearchaeota archaeon]|nr:MAG: 30S ribosomal protein S3 [Candidatus Woesearchaeota archaeon]
MIERGILKERIKRLNIKKKIRNTLRKSAGVGSISIEPTPLGERITLHAVRPGLVIGSGGKNIKDITQDLKTKFQLENPQIKVNEEEKPFLSAKIVAETIASRLERFGISRFKATGYRALERIIESGAIGAEIRISGKVPSARARSWRFYAGYLKKCGETSRLVDSAVSLAKLKSGAVGIKVNIMPPGIELPDNVKIRKEIKIEEETKAEAEILKEVKELKEEVKEAIQEDKAEVEKKQKQKKVPARKKPVKKEVKKKKPTKKKETKKEVKKPKAKKKDGSTKGKRSKKAK